MNIRNVAPALFIALCLSLYSMKSDADNNNVVATQPNTAPGNEVALDLGNKVTLKMVLVPAGKFLMGSPKDEKGRLDREGLRHKVIISKPFYMGIYSVTQEQYEQVMGKNPSKFKGAQHPVDWVSWGDAAKFCKVLSKKTGKKIVLPTEAQWEYACRAGSITRFYYGDDNDYAMLSDFAWYDKNSFKATHPVGQKKPNAWGLYDMHGNIWQWCSDWCIDSYEETEKTDPAGPALGKYRILRGGSLWFHPEACRSAGRGRDVPDARRDDVGFRVIADLE